MAVLKRTLQSASKPPKGTLRAPRSTQDVIPVTDAFDDGVFLSRDGWYSRQYSFNDINYSELSDDEKEQKLLCYCSILNSIDKGARGQITLVFRPMTQEQYSRDVLLASRPDELEELRGQMNDVLQTQVHGNIGMRKECFLTVSSRRHSYKDAQSFFERIGGQLSDGFQALGVQIKPVSLTERLRLLHDMYRPGMEAMFHFDERDKARGQSFKDVVAPLSVEDTNTGRRLKIGDRYCCTEFLNGYPSFLTDSLVGSIAEIKKPLIFSIHFLPIPMDEAMDEAQQRSDAAELKIVDFNLRQQRNKNFSGLVPYRYTVRSSQAREVLEALTKRDQNLYLTTVAVTHFADTAKELSSDSAEIYSKGKAASCQFLPLTWQQLPGFNTALPYGQPFITADRLLITQALAGLCPFSAQEIYQPGGTWYGMNPKTHRLIVVNRKMPINGNSVILATSGGGKSFFVKEEALQLGLKETAADIIFLDPEREYSALTHALHGEVIAVSPSSTHSVNPLELDAEYSDSGTPVKEKTDFILSFCQMLLGGDIDSALKTIIDRCTQRIYEPYVKSGFTSQPPTLKELRRELEGQSEPQAKDLALRMELYTEGSFDMFARQSNVDTNARILDFDLSALGKHMEDVGMLVVLEAVYNRVMRNHRQHRLTYIFVDEIMYFFHHEYSAEYFVRLWQRIRKRGGFICGATQNASDVLANPSACALLKNSLITVMLAQTEPDRHALAELFSLSDAQQESLATESHGAGLVKLGSTIVPFENRFPTDSPLYAILTTKPGDNWGDVT